MAAPILSSSKVGSFKNAVAVTKSDTVANNFRALWIGGAGNVALVDANGNAAITLTAVPAGTLLPIAVSLVKSTGTTATNIVGLS